MATACRWPTRSSSSPGSTDSRAGRSSPRTSSRWRGSLDVVANFEAAADAIVSGDIATLRALLREHPGLARARSTREHRSTLLHYVSANGVEDFRQITPQNIVEITKLLLDAGADVNAESEAYGGGSTTLGLAATSIHPEQAGVQIELLELLLARGAEIEKPGLTGNQHSAVWGCLANGQGRAARFFADRGARHEPDRGSWRWPPRPGQELLR